MGKMYFNFVKNIGDCKVCSSYFNLKDIFDHFKLGRLKGATTSFEEFEKYILEKFSNTEEELGVEVEEEIDPEPLPDMIMLGDRHFPHKLEKYLEKKRVIVDRNAGCCGVSVDPEHKYFSRLIIPVYDHFTNEYLGYQARKTREADTGPKFLFSKGFRKAKALYVDDRFGYRPREVVPIVENALVALGYQGVATFGKSLSEEQVDFLILLKRAYPHVRYTLIWDEDASEAQGKFSAIQKALDKCKNDLEIKVLLIKGQPDDYTFKQIVTAQENLWESPWKEAAITNVVKV